jgi:hypothetical protein
MGRRRAYLTVPVIGLLILAYPLTTACSATASGAPPDPPTPTTGPPPPTPTSRYPLLETDRGAFDATAEADGRIWRTSGTTTAGSKIEVDGVTIQLPADAYIDVLSGNRGYGCTDPQNCPEPPIYKLVRWNSSVWVDDTRTLRDEKTPPGEEHAFDFLREALE